MPRCRKFFENDAVDTESGSKMALKLCSRMAGDFHSRELPHAREEHVVVSAGIFHQECAAAPIAKNRSGYFYVHCGAFDVGRRNSIGEAELVCTAPFRDRADRATRILRSANGLAQFH